MAGNSAQAADLGHGALPPLIHHSHGYTDFTAYTHSDLYNMLFAGDPASIREAAAAWQSTGRMLADQAAQLKHKLTAFSQMWQGKAADEYHVMITDLAGGLEKVSDDALAMNNLMASSAEALDTARATMPPPQLVPDLDPAVLAAATAVAPPEIAMSPDAQAQFAATQLQAQQAVQAHQAQLDSSHAAQAQAVLVMQKLSTEYGSTEDSIPATPETVQAVPDSPADDKANSLTKLSGPGGTPVPTLTADGTDPSGGSFDGGSTTDAALITSTGVGATGTAASASVPDSPLFGHMFTAGLAAASAAAAGRFGSVMPKLPGFLNPQKKKTAAKTSSGAVATKAAAAAAVARTAALKLGGGGGAGGLGSGGLGAGVTGPEAPAATAYSGLIGGTGTSGVAGAAAAGQLAGAAVGTPGASGTSMPMMPMGGMAGAGGGDLGNRRIPPWLVETEDVWGESSTVSPPVIGEDF